jgi:hypothetical protein
MRDKGLLVACVAMAALLLPGIAIADAVTDSALSLTYLDSMHTLSSSLRLGTAQNPDRLAAATQQNADSLSPAAWSGARLIEMPRNDPPGTYSRPHYALGFQSQSMRTWLNGLGIDATTCLAPVLRARSKLSSSGQLGGTLSLSARCDLR